MEGDGSHYGSTITKSQKEHLLALYSMNMFKSALDRKELTVSNKMREVKDNWLKDSNHVLRFIEEKCEVDMESNEADPSKAIYESYQSFCYQESLREMSRSEEHTSE